MTYEDPTMLPLAGQTAMITGASEGLGRAIAEGYAMAGAKVVAVGRTEAKLAKVVHSIRTRGGSARFEIADVTDADEVQSAVARTVDKYGTINLLVTAAGFSRPGPAYDVHPRDAAEMISVGLLGTFLACQAAGRVMRDTGGGAIVTLSSTFAQTVSPGTSVYASVKAGVSHLTRSLAVEWATDGIRINSLAPTAVETPSRSAVMNDDLRGYLLSRIPLARFAQFADVVPTAVYLASSAAAFVTGQTLYIDGGWTAKG